ncbi:FAS-associated factor 1 [Lingula anatina]|uniref:FAS-associated factor 1 n=1 Tax=Lingula anatina TaxID=7574 RepID=A0A1S3IFJ2_LINAN|nr:FAS-associated factor 1 [Lingula anatina]|eukprot:XP_013397035.1 FAS-associated factor 1 [Lingula anatina]
MAEDSDRNRILADFQACTNIEDIGECIAVLEQNEWNLLGAINSVMAHLGSQELPSEASYPPLEVQGQGLGSPVDSPPPDYQVFQPQPQEEPGSCVFNPHAMTSDRDSTPPTRMLTFNVEYRDRNIPVVLPDTEKVETIKQVLHGQIGNIPIEKMVLRGFPNKHAEDYTMLRLLNLPQETTLYLLTPGLYSHMGDTNNSQSAESSNILERLSQNFTLNIRFRDKDTTYKLNFPGSRTVKEVKNDVGDVIDVPVRLQKWTGWPDSASDETMTLAGCGVGFPCHNLEVSRTQREPARLRHLPMDVAMDVGSSEDDFEDAHESLPMDDDDIYDEDVPMSRKLVPLMPDDVGDEVAALEHFSRVFAERYGDIHPVFFIGKLEDAIKEALACKAKDRKLLAIYLHHDSSILANVFCSQILCSESVVSFLSNNFITWAWDLTSEANKAKCLTMCTREFGSMAAQTVRDFKTDNLPLLLLITRTRSTNEVVNVIQGIASLDELMTNLINAVDVFTEQQRADVLEEEERDARERVKFEQDKAYEESLAADRAKEESKRLEQEKRFQEETEKEKKKLEERLQREQEEAEKEAIQQSLADQLPDEPPADSKEPISILRIRIPGGEFITRRFLAKHPLQILLNFITSKGYHMEEYKVLTTYPRRDISTQDPEKSLEELKLFPQETLMLEEKTVE